MCRNLSLALVLNILSISTAFSNDISFFVAADPHYGYCMWEDDEQTNKEAIQDMNHLPGLDYPSAFSAYGVEKVKSPFGVIVAGDLTGSGSAFDWGGYLFRSGFNQDYQVNGNGLLHYLVFEGYGNHDVDSGSEAILIGMKMRNRQRDYPTHVSNNGLHYSWDVDGVHFVQLNVFPGNEGNAHNSLDFLQQDLATHVGNSGRGIILIHHYEFYWAPDVWFHLDEQQRYYDIIKNYHILAIFTGHTHTLNQYLWNNIPVFVAPAVKDNAAYFAVHITQEKLLVALRSKGQWLWWHIHDLS